MNVRWRPGKLQARLVDRMLGNAGSQQLSVLNYHRVLETEDYMRQGDPTLEQFTWQMELISRLCNPLSLTDALRLLNAGTLPERAVCVTFDDGYADNLNLAFPILKKYGVPFTVFVSTGFLDGGRMWNDTVLEAVRVYDSSHIELSEVGLGRFTIGSDLARQKTAHDILEKIKYLSPPKRQDVVDCLARQSGQLPTNLMLTTEQLIDLHSKGAEIGAHTHSHPILSNLAVSDAKMEVETSKIILERVLGDKVRYFAYPNGKPGKDYSPGHRDLICDLGFDAAFSTVLGVSGRNSDRWQLPRFTPWDATPQRFLMRLLWNQRNIIEAG